jgi:hypothetical protein
MKISVVGAGNGGCFTALHYAWYTRTDPRIEVELIYNPKIQPERVGQATLLDAPGLLWAATDFNWYDNPIHATFKSGIVYEGWGNKNNEVFHPFPADKMAMHYCPWEMQKLILNSGNFKVVEDEVDPYNVDADYVFDCRGKPEDLSQYHKLRNPINAAILAKPKWDTSINPWSRHVATPDGWTFVIPTKDSSPSNRYCIGYCYNDSITSEEEAEKNFLNMFDVEITKHVHFHNYVAKEPVVDGRVFKNGNRLFFLEPLESSSTQTYIEWAKMSWEYIFDDIQNPNERILNYIKQIQNFVLWHYQFGSKYKTPFWEYAALPMFHDNEFHEFLDCSKKSNSKDIIPSSYGGLTKDNLYGQWPAYSFKNWFDGMTR